LVNIKQHPLRRILQLFPSGNNVIIIGYILYCNIISFLYINIFRLSFSTLIFDSLTVRHPARTGEEVSAGGLGPQLTVPVGVHAGLPVPALARVAPGLAESRPVVRDLSGPVDVKLLHAVGEGAGLTSLTAPSLTVDLAEHHLHRPGRRGQRGLPGGDGGTDLTGGVVLTVSSLSDVPTQLVAAELVEAVSCRTERPVTLPGLEPHLAQLSPRLHGPRPEIVLGHRPQLQLSVGELALGGELTFTRLLVVFTKNRLELRRVELVVSKERAVVVDQLGGVVVLVDLQLGVTMSVLTDGSELALSSGHVVLAQCSLVVGVDLRQVLLNCPQL